jgi:hypothetical protein
VRPAEAFRLVLKDRPNLMVIKGETGDNYYRFLTREELAEETRLKDPAMLNAFKRLALDHAPKSDFAALPCKQHRVRGYLELLSYGGPELQEDIARRARTNVREVLKEARTVMVYRVHLTRVGVVFFGANQRPSYSYLVYQRGINLP